MGFGDLARDLRFGGFGDGGAACAGAVGHLGADRAKLGHDLAMHRAGVVAVGGHGHVADNGFFDTKTFATNRHEIFPTPSLRLFYADAI